MGIFDRLGRWNRGRNLNRSMVDVARAAFPGGHKQFLAESQLVFEMVGNSFTKEDAGRILSRTKAMMFVANDKSRERIVASMMSAHPGLSVQAANDVYSLLCTLVDGDVPGAMHHHNDGGGRVPEDGVIVITNKSRILGIDEEYAWIEARHGKQGRDWNLVVQMYKTAGERSYDVLEIRTSSGDELTITFDITAFDRPGGPRGPESHRSRSVDGLAAPVRASVLGAPLDPARAALSAQPPMQQFAVFEPHFAPRRLSTDDLIAEPLTTVMCRGTSHPCALSVEAMVIPGDVKVGGRVPVCMILLTPTRHWASEIGTVDLRRGTLVNAISALALRLVPSRPRQCPRVLMYNEHFNERQAASLFIPMIQYSQGASLLRDEILSAPDDPFGRAEAYLALCRANLERFRSEGAELFCGEEIDAAEAELMAAHLIRPSCMQAELGGLTQVWDMMLKAMMADGRVDHGADSQALMRYLAPIMLTCRIA